MPELVRILLSDFRQLVRAITDQYSGHFVRSLRRILDWTINSRPEERGIKEYEAALAYYAKDTPNYGPSLSRPYPDREGPGATANLLDPGAGSPETH